MTVDWEGVAARLRTALEQDGQLVEIHRASLSLAMAACQTLAHAEQSSRSSSEPSETGNLLERAARRTDREAQRLRAEKHEQNADDATADAAALRALARCLRAPAVDAGTTDTQSCTHCDGDGYAPAQHPTEDGERFDDCPVCNGSGERVTNEEILKLRARAGDVEPLEYELAELRASLRSAAVDDETVKLLAQVAKAATAFCAELQEDGEGVPQPELRALHAALDAVDLAKLEADWLTHLAVCYRCNEDHRDPCDIGARIRAEMDALDERIDSAAARRSPESAPEEAPNA